MDPQGPVSYTHLPSAARGRSLLTFPNYPTMRRPSGIPPITRSHHHRCTRKYPEIVTPGCSEARKKAAAEKKDGAHFLNTARHCLHQPTSIVEPRNVKEEGGVVGVGG